VLRVADELGIRVPDDLAVVGFDNVKEAAELSVPLTTVAQSGVQVGKRACELLLTRIDNPNSLHHREFLPVELIVRRSCGAAP
jgi:DNA-binding LacI/PurR family transcriptional regulator